MNQITQLLRHIRASHRLGTSIANMSQVARVRYFTEPSRRTIRIFIIFNAFLYILMMAHIPIAVSPGFPHDDGLFIKLGRYLAEGRWLGPYSQWTLMKGPGYPAFLAFANWLALPVTIAQALFQCLAITFFVAICHRMIKSYFISALLLVFLTWHPLSMSRWLLRILREEIYYGQTLLVLAFAIWITFYLAPRYRLRAIIGGLIFGWFWLTREEGVWIFPGLAIIIFAGMLHAYRLRRIRSIGISLLVFFAAFVGTQLSFSTINLFVYHKFVGVDVKERNFLRALRAIQSVRSGGTKPHVSITYAGMARIDAISPAFASLKSYFNGPGQGWKAYGCSVFPSTCGEIAAGWFMWALRDAAQSTGHYASATSASEFYGRIADQIDSACAKGQLSCRPQLIADMPQFNLSDVISSMERGYVTAFNMLLMRNPSLSLDQSGGTGALLPQALRFLDYPPHTKPVDSPGHDRYVISGWYYKSGSDWFSEAVSTAKGAPAYSRLLRRASQDLRQAFKDPKASNQRFTLFTECNDTCVLRLQIPSGNSAKYTLKSLRNAPTDLYLGKGHIHIESINFYPDPQYVLTPFDRLCFHVRNAILRYYSYAFLPLLALGALTFVLTILVFPKRASRNLTFATAAACWVLVVVRVTLLLLISATSFPALFPFYLGPAYYLMVAATFLSLSAVTQMARPPTRRNISSIDTIVGKSY